MGEWTKGEWRATKHTDTRGWTVSAAGVSVASVRPRTQPGEAEANARLFAAAPALYEALKACLQDSHFYTVELCAPDSAGRREGAARVAAALQALAQADGAEPRDA